VVICRYSGLFDFIISHFKVFPGSLSAFCSVKAPRTFEVIASEYRWELYKVVYGVLQIKVKA
jgi:hypothetical protein